MRLNAALAAMCLSCPLIALSAPPAVCTPNPVFSPLPGEGRGRCEEVAFHKLTLLRSRDAAGAAMRTERSDVEGQYWEARHPLQPVGGGEALSPLEVQRNYANAVHQAGGTVLHLDDSAGRLHFRVQVQGTTYAGITGCGARRKQACLETWHQIIRVAAMQPSVVVSAEQIASAMTESGRVTFYGLYFDSGKAVLRPDSAPSLEEMARWLQSHAQARVYIVGHTDMQGHAEQNVTLSRQRAAAVVEALATRHGIAADRLGSEGVGPYAPVASNADEAGRAKNRRVEMVMR